MSDRTKDLILKTVLVIGFILLLMFFPGCFFISFFISNEEVFGIIYYTTLFSFFGVGVLFMILCPVLGGLKQKPVKADKVALPFESYDQFLVFLRKSLLQRKYKLQKSVSILSNSEVIVYVKQSKRNVLESFSIIRTSELSDELIEIANDSITKILTEYYGGKTITDTVNMISIFCVDRITPSFQSLVNSNMQQGLKNGRLVVGVSFGGKNIYIAKQDGGFAIAKYKQLRKEFIDVMNLENK